MLEPFVNSKKIKYVVLDDILYPYLSGATKEVTMHINLESILKTFYRKDLIEAVRSLDQERHYMLSSELLNIVAHYRHYFWSRWQVPSTFFISYSDKKAVYNTKLNPDFKKSYYEKIVKPLPEYAIATSVVNENVELSKIIADYISNVFVVNTGTLETSTLFQYAIDNYNTEDNLNIVLTTNENDFQLVNNPETVILTMNGDNSKVIDQENIMYETFLKKSKSVDETDVPCTFYNLINAISGLNKMDVKGLKGYGKIKTIKLIEKHLSDIGLDIEAESAKPYLEHLSFNKTEQQIIERNYRTLSIKNNLSRITPSQEDNMKKQLNNFKDDESLEDLNAKYYPTYPLYLIELNEGEY